MQAGGQGVFGIERHPSAFETLNQNLCAVNVPPARRFAWPDWLPTQAHDVQTFNRKYLDKLRQMRGSVDVVVGGPPCQGFSFSGRRDASDPRNRMLYEFVKSVDSVRPRFALVENVLGLNAVMSGRRAKTKKVYTINFGARLRDQLSRIGYFAVSFIVNAEDCGVPQRRHRLITIAIRHDLIAKDSVPNIESMWAHALVEHKASLGFQAGRSISAKAAISDLEIAYCGTASSKETRGFDELRYRRARTNFQKQMRGSETENFDVRLPQHKPPTVEKFRYLQENCVPGKSLTAAQREVAGRRKMRQAVLAANLPSPTLTTLPDDLIHYSEPRILTVREYARLQTFPDWFRFAGSYTTGGARRLSDCPRYTQVGNAVPVLMGRALGFLLIGLLKQYGAAGDELRSTTDCANIAH